MGLGRRFNTLFVASTISNLGDGIGLIAYPWLASAVTRNPVLIALVAVAQRLPWLVFSLPAGVITDRRDRRLLMVGANATRAVLTTLVAVLVIARGGDLPGPDAVDDLATSISTDAVLYIAVVLATLLLGVAEVLYDNSAQTFLPAIVDSASLEKANGRLWSAEQVANTLAGPPLGALLLAVTFSLPFFVDALTFAVSAALIAFIAVPRRAQTSRAASPAGWRAELSEGFSWLWRHDLLRPLAVFLGLINLLSTLAVSVLVLFAQEVLETSPTEFALLSTGGAVGGVIGGWSASAMARRLGSGPSLWATFVMMGVTNVVIGVTSSWIVVWVMFAVSMLFSMLWNVITVSLRQQIIPDELLGRVNSVYRFFGWGMMPIGALLGGIIVSGVDAIASRELALRMPFLIAGVASLVLLVFALPRLTTERIETARSGNQPVPGG